MQAATFISIETRYFQRYCITLATDKNEQ